MLEISRYPVERERGNRDPLRRDGGDGEGSSGGDSKLAASLAVARRCPHTAASAEPARARRAGDIAPYLHRQLGM